MLQFVFLIAICLFSLPVHAQRIGVVEKTNYPSWDTDNQKNKYKYSIVIRDLFEKKNNTWEDAGNWDWESDTLKRATTEYFFPIDKKLIRIKGRIKMNRGYQSHELFAIMNPPKIKLFALPKSIIEQFEYNDIIANRIVTDNKKLILNKPQFPVSLLTEKEKSIIHDTIIGQMNRCFGWTVDSTYDLWVKKSYIENETRLLPNNLRLGKANIPWGNSCFTAGYPAYGGGVLHYIIDENLKVQLLVTNTELLAAADFDNDGTLEYIFMKSKFNSYGYILYYNNFQNRIINSWSYH